MNPRALSIATRRLGSPPRSLVLQRTLVQQRFASSDRQPSNVSQFYKTFTRPVAKVLLMAVFTYQLAYWGWVKLEQDEIRAEREADIEALETQVASLSGQQTLRRAPDGWTTPEYWTAKLRQQEQRMAIEQQGNPLKSSANPREAREEYEKQLAKLEDTIRKTRELRAAEGMNGPGADGEKKAAPWWKVW